MSIKAFYIAYRLGSLDKSYFKVYPEWMLNIHFHQKILFYQFIGVNSQSMKNGNKKVLVYVSI